MKRLITMLAISFFIAGCGAKEPPKKVQKKKPLTETEILKRKARVVKVGNLIGYDGDRIQKNLNKVIDSRAKHKKELENALKDMQ